MSNPIAIFENLRDTYFRYLDSPFDLRYPDLVAERRRLLDVDGRLYRHPLIEPVPAYQLCGQTFSQAAQALFGPTWPQPIVADLSSLCRQLPLTNRAVSSNAPERSPTRAVHASARGV